MNKVVTPEDKRQLLCDFDHLVTWSEKWQMNFNADKCKVLHMESNNYHNNGSEFVKVNEEKKIRH